MIIPAIIDFIKIFIGNTTQEDTEAMFMKLRRNIVICFAFNFMEVTGRLRIFTFFAYFVRQVIEIIHDSLPLASALGLNIVGFALIFWVLDKNSIEPQFEGFAGFGYCLLSSYKLALGDFDGITESFGDNTEN